MDSKTVKEILHIASDIDLNGFPRLDQELQKPLILGKMFYGAKPFDGPICDLAAARLGMYTVDLSWTDADIKDTQTLLDDLRMNSKAVDILVTAFSSHETFGDGRHLTKQFSEVSAVPVLSLHDDFYDWQAALAHLLGFQKQLGTLKKKQIVISWAFGSSFVNPAVAHGLMISGLLAEANVRVVTPPEFSLLNRIKRKAREITSELGSTYEESSSFTDAFENADAIFFLNWLRLDDFNHQDRNPRFANKYKDWYITEDILSQHAVLSTEPPVQLDISVSSEIANDLRNITNNWLLRRLQVLAATIHHALHD